MSANPFQPEGSLDIEMPEPEVERPERLTGKIIGYRGWTLDGYRLVSANARQHAGWWQIGPNKAECRAQQRVDYVSRLAGDAVARRLWDRLRSAGPHDAPHADCECGLYAYFGVCREHNPHFSAAKSFVWGAIAAWGHIEVHASGFRAEWAQPVALGYDPTDPREQLEKHQAIAEELGLPFVPFTDLEAEALKHGQVVPEAMRPEGRAGTLAGLSQMFGAISSVGISMAAMSECMKHVAERMRLSQEALHAMQMAPITITASKPRKPKGVKATLRTTGPPFVGRWREGDVVRDRRRDLWVCTGSGRPGSWEKL